MVPLQHSLSEQISTLCQIHDINYIHLFHRKSEGFVIPLQLQNDYFAFWKITQSLNACFFWRTALQGNLVDDFSLGNRLPYVPS